MTRCVCVALLFCIAVAVPIEETPKASVQEIAQAPVVLKELETLRVVTPVGPLSEEEVVASDLAAQMPEESSNDEAGAPAEILNLVSSSLKEDAKFPFQSGTLNILVGREEVVETNIPNPVIFISPVLIGINTAEFNPALVPRAKLVVEEGKDKNGAITKIQKFLVTAAVEPCATQDSEERVHYFIVSARQANEDAAYVANESSDPENNRFWVFTAKVNLNEGMTAGQVFPFGKAPKKRLNKASREKWAEEYFLAKPGSCLTTIQTRNVEGYLQSNAHARPNNGETYLRVRGTYNEGIRNDGGSMVKENGKLMETVAAFCVGWPGVNTPLTLKLGEMDLRFEVVKSLRGPGVFNVVPGADRTKVVTGGQMAGKNPYHIRSWDIINSNGVHMFKIEEDKCSNPHTRHTEELVLTAAFA